MIDDPDDPDYRYPEPGERYWHGRQERWVFVCPAESRVRGRHYRALGEVPVEREDDGSLAIVKLYNLEDSS